MDVSQGPRSICGREEARSSICTVSFPSASVQVMWACISSPAAAWIQLEYEDAGDVVFPSARAIRMVVVPTRGSPTHHHHPPQQLITI
ncbi:hypothetical protein ACQJBY_001335 [Aegilops geniculata]